MRRSLGQSPRFSSVKWPDSPATSLSGGSRSAAGLDGPVAFLFEEGDHLVAMVPLKLDAGAAGGSADPAVLLEPLCQRPGLVLVERDLRDRRRGLSLPSGGLPLHLDRRSGRCRTRSARILGSPLAFLPSPLLLRAKIPTVARPHEFRIRRQGGSRHSGFSRPTQHSRLPNCRCRFPRCTCRPG